MWTRRTLLALAAASATGCSFLPSSSNGYQWGSEPVQRTPGDLVPFDSVGGAKLLYADGDRPSSMKSEPKFLAQMNAWAEDWAKLSGLGAITSITSYGAYVDKPNSYHQIGQAFDITAVKHKNGSVSLRYDKFKPGTAKQLRNYWRLAASIHLHFAYVLTYPYNEQHHNHIHFDNQISGSELSTFDSSSKSQLHVVQYGLRHVFGHKVEATGSYDAQTKDAVRKVQKTSGLTTPLREPDGWHGFLRALARG